MPIPSHPDLGLVLRQLAESEINLSLECFYDAGWTVRLGDPLNGIVAQERFRQDELDQVPSWLIAVASDRYPRSEFAKIYAIAPAND